MFDENYCNREDEDLLFQQIRQMKSRIEAEIATNIDPRKKELGDRVIVWDGSYSEAVSDPKKNYSGIELNDHTCIVIAINQNYAHKKEYMDGEQILDLVVHSLKFSRDIRTSSDCVRILD